MNGKPGFRSLLLLVACLATVLVVLFHESFMPGQALFSNDGPLGIILSRPLEMPAAFVSIWNDTHWIGAYNGNLTPNFSGLIHWVFQGVGRVNFFAPMSALILGLCAWVYFRSIHCSSRVSILAALAAALNMNFFSNAAWGLGTRGLSLAAAFLALTAVEAGFVVQPVLCSILAGLAIGLSITEGGDNGAIFSVFIAAYAFWRTWISIPSRGQAAAWGVGKVVVMAVFAGIMASQTLGLFLRTSVTGVVGTGQDAQTREQKWDGNTMWSLPKMETLRVIIPGVFGYRMDTPDGGNYWGRVGEQPAAPYVTRSSGAGEYAGVLVVLLALWAIVESLRGKGQTFTLAERKLIWFWAVMGVVAMLLGWGRHAPFYKLLYALPYISTIRNPMKFFHALHLCLMILFAYGLLGVNRRYLDVPAKGVSLFGQLKAWWAKGPAHEKLWTWGCIAAVVLSAIGWFGYKGSRGSLIKHLSETGFPDQAVATAMAGFSIHEVLLFVLTLAISVAVLTFIISGAFAGPRARWATLLLGTVLVLDLARADRPWIIYSKWKEKYAPNAVLDTLRDKPYEHRVAIPNLRVLVQLPDVRQYFTQQPQVFQVTKQMYEIYYGEWVQHQMPYFAIQSLDIPQEPRLPADKEAYLSALGLNWARLWELTNVRFLCGEATTFADMLNQKFDPVKRRFRVHTPFAFVPNGEGIGVQTNATGPSALIEFTGALPRAKLYHHWETMTDEKALLTKLADPNWEPAQSLLLSQGAPPPTATNTAPGQAVILANPSPRLMEIQTTSDTPAMLLLNDKIDSEWHAYIDGQETPVMRANYLMRAVAVPAGTHKVLFKYQSTARGFYIVLGCELAGLLLLGVVLWSARRKQAATPVK